MSRVGRKPLKIAEGVTISVDGQTVTVRGPKGELEHAIPAGITAKIEGDELLISRDSEVKFVKSLHGTVQRTLDNAIKGTTLGWSKTLELVGTGYRARLEGASLILAIGFSHPVRFDPPEGITFNVEEASITVSGIDRHLVGQTAANVRAVRPPEPYKGKGIKYVGEYIRRKAGKAAKTVTAA